RAGRRCDWALFPHLPGQESVIPAQCGSLPSVAAAAIFMLAYLQRIGSQLFVLGDIINGYDQAFLDASPMAEMLGIENKITDASGAVDLPKTSSKLSFKDASYKYEDSDQDVLKNLQLTIPAGQKVGLVGHSGAGKTTITHLLLRFADVTRGSITINNRDIRDVTQHSLRSAIAYVPQEPMLFHRSLRENIAYGNPNATDKDIQRAAKQANALEFIETLPQGLDTEVGERGVKLSGGQRQRIAIARAILKDAPILILDEATSALDSESEKLIQDALEKLMKDRTSIVVAHRLSTIAKLDRIIVLENGSIIEDGTHNELLKMKGSYAKLWSHQSGGFIEE
ncbi:MAG: ATP-binding cassette domain-containing protein, partial [Proteobacteria bacterium]